ncbi:MAG: hypothetical protein PHW10_02020 [Candidatus Peribacteraceae bacterium]|nr:hypothetical protein [Candidatus Peribacteraceae bacterium]
MKTDRHRNGCALFARERHGYVFLLSVLAVGTIASATAASLLLLGGAVERTTFAIEQSLQAYENAGTCVERALVSLRADLAYPGGETLTLARGTCDLRETGGAGSGPRTVCAAGRSGKAVRHLEVRLETIYPRVTVVSWREVPSITLCP